MLLPFHSAKPVTSPQNGLRPRWLPEIKEAVSKPVADTANWLQTSVRPGYDGLTVKSESASEDGDGHAPASIQPFANQRTLIDGGVGATGSKQSDNYQYRQQNKSAEVRSSMTARLMKSASSDDDDFLNKTLSEKR